MTDAIVGGIVADPPLSGGTIAEPPLSGDVVADPPFSGGIVANSSLSGAVVADPPFSGDVSQGPGVAGPKGATGDRGAPGSTRPTLSFSFEQPLTTWLLPHGLGLVPDVITLDTGGEVILGTVRHIDLDTTTVSFAYPTSGVAHTI